MQAALNRGLLPDDNTLTQLAQEQESPVYGHSVESLKWPDPELRVVLIRESPLMHLIAAYVGQDIIMSSITSPLHCVLKRIGRTTTLSLACCKSAWVLCGNMF